MTSHTEAYLGDVELLSQLPDDPCQLLILELQESVQ